MVWLYGKRWEIEVFFRTAKQFLALEQRRHDDPRTLGLLFHACYEEMRDMSFMEALGRILDLALDWLRQNPGFSETV